MDNTLVQKSNKAIFIIANTLTSLKKAGANEALQQLYVLYPSHLKARWVYSP